MCGIYFSCTTHNNPCPLSTQLRSLLINRGPDSSSSLNLRFGDFVLNCFSSVLHFRQEKIVNQPVVDEYSNVLLFNGEIYTDLADKSDTIYFSEGLSKCQDDKAVLEFVSSIEGPFAFVYVQNSSKKVWFGRDIIGRRSLCIRITDDPFQLIISSVCAPHEPEWIEVPANGIRCLDLASRPTSTKDLIIYPWSHSITGELVSDSSPLSFKIIYPLNTVVVNEGSSCEDSLMKSYVTQFHEVLKKAVHKRIQFSHKKCNGCFHANVSNCTHSSIAVLFSGGIDSTVLAALSDNFVPSDQSIDLLNVAFSKDAPDRQSALIALEELKSICPARRWRFVSIDVSREELSKIRDNQIKHLIRPQNTVLDDSIGCALWFAARGESSCLSNDHGDLPYKSPSRIVLLGMGADEQLAGYSRHRKVFQEKKISGLINELRKEINEISRRNLGRDDRIISDHGREGRFPFLDEEVISFLNSVPLNYKANLNLPRGYGEKILLRKLALEIGLKKTASSWKRAIQFGSRIAHLEGKGEKGDFACSRLG